MTVRCIYCNSNAQVDWGGEFFKCQSCELVYRRTMPGEAELIEMYSQCYSQDKIVSGDTDMDSGSVALRNHADFIGSMLRPPARVLDYGAGTGELVQLLSDRGYRATGCEPSANAREEARRKYGFSLFSSLDEVQEGSCDLVVAIEVVEDDPTPRGKTLPHVQGRVLALLSVRTTRAIDRDRPFTQSVPVRFLRIAHELPRFHRPSNASSFRASSSRDETASFLKIDAT